MSLLHIHSLILSFYISFRQWWTITCLAPAPGAIEEFEPEAASSDDVAVEVGALLEVSAARGDISIKP